MIWASFSLIDFFRSSISKDIWWIWSLENDISVTMTAFKSQTQNWMRMSNLPIFLEVIECDLDFNRGLGFDSYNGISIPSWIFLKGEFTNSYFEEISFFSLLENFLNKETNLDFRDKVLRQLASKASTPASWELIEKLLACSMSLFSMIDQLLERWEETGSH